MFVLNLKTNNYLQICRGQRREIEQKKKDSSTNVIVLLTKLFFLIASFIFFPALSKFKLFRVPHLHPHDILYTFFSPILLPFDQLRKFPIYPELFLFLLSLFIPCFFIQKQIEGRGRKGASGFVSREILRTFFELYFLCNSRFLFQLLIIP